MRITFFLLYLIGLSYSQDMVFPDWAKKVLENDAKIRVELSIIDLAKKGVVVNKERINLGIYRFYESRKLSIMSCANKYKVDKEEYSSMEEKIYTYARAAEIIDGYFLEYYSSGREKRLTEKFVSDMVRRGVNSGFLEARGISVLGNDVLIKRFPQPFGNILVGIVENRNILVDDVESSNKVNSSGNQNKMNKKREKKERFYLYWLLLPLCLIIFMIVRFSRKDKGLRKRARKKRVGNLTV